MKILSVLISITLFASSLALIHYGLVHNLQFYKYTKTRQIWHLICAWLGIVMLVSSVPISFILFKTFE